MPNDTQRVSDVLEVSLGRGTLLKDDLTGVANVLVEVFDSTGALKDSRAVHNLVVDAGKTHIAAVMSSGGATAMGWMAIGTGSTAPAAGNTALGTEIDRNALTSRTSASNVTTYVGDWAAGDGTNAAIAEAGILNASSAATSPLARRSQRSTRVLRT